MGDAVRDLIEHGRTLLGDLDVPTMDAVRRQAAATKLHVRSGEAGVDAGLLADSLIVSTQDHWPDDVAAAFERTGLTEKYGEGAAAGLRSLTHPLDPHQVDGITNNVKGVALEQQTVEAINDGHLGSFPEGAHAALSDSLTTPGWDIEITDRAGHVIDHLQVKAGTLDTVREHLDRYPEVGLVVTTHETAIAAGDAGLGDHVIDSGVDGAQLTDHVHDVADNLTLAHGIHEVIPEITLAIIASTVVYRVHRGEPVNTAVAWGKQRAIDSGIANGAGLVASMALGDPLLLRPLVTISTRFGILRARRAHESARHLRRMGKLLQTMRAEAAGWAATGAAR